MLKGFETERVVFAADHPEAHIRPRTDLQQALRYGTTLNLAVLLSNCQAELPESYYIDRIRKRYLKCCRVPEIYNVLEAVLDLHLKEWWTGRRITRHDVSAEIALYSYGYSSKSWLTFAQQFLASLAPDAAKSMGNPGLAEGKATSKKACVIGREIMQ